MQVCKDCMCDGVQCLLYAKAFATCTIHCALFVKAAAHSIKYAC
jgi:hypothetical protein